MKLKNTNWQQAKKLENTEYKSGHTVVGKLCLSRSVRDP
jgi:hypothetical protein